MAGDRSFRSVGQLLAAHAPAAAIQIQALGPGGARALFRYQAAEQNRWYFETWDLLLMIPITAAQRWHAFSRAQQIFGD